MIASMRILLAALAFSVLAQAQAPKLELYYVVFLRPEADVQPLSKVDAENLQTVHLSNMRELNQAGILVAAGPMADAKPTISGIFVLRAASMQQAVSIASLDPTVMQHRNSVEVHPWRGPEGIGDAYAKWKFQERDAEDTMLTYAFAMFYKGPNWTPGAKDHRAWVAQQISAGKLAAGGETEDDDSGLAGIYVFKTSSLEEAQRLAAANPAVKSGLVRVEWHRWSCADRVLPW
jgi:uncharacterized protein YciI